MNVTNQVRSLAAGGQVLVNSYRPRVSGQFIDNGPSWKVACQKDGSFRTPPLPPGWRYASDLEAPRRRWPWRLRRRA
jgi:hypothetical protein